MATGQAKGLCGLRCDFCNGEVAEVTPLNKLSKITCVMGHIYSKLKADGDVYFQNIKEVKKDNPIKRAKPSMSEMWKGASRRG